MHKDLTPRARIVRLMALLYEHRELTTSAAARLLGEEGEQGRRRVLDDLHILVEHSPVERVDEGREARYVLRSELLSPHVGITDRLALLIGRKHTAFLDHTMLASPVDLEPARGQRLRNNLSVRRLQQLVHYVDEPARPYRKHDKVLETVLDALFASQKVSFDYKSASRSIDAWTDLSPLSLVVYRRSLSVLVTAPTLPEPRLFAVDRIARATRGETFPYPEDWDPAAHFAHTFGILTTPPAERVVMRFSAKVARYVRARSWHPTATLHDLPGGGVELRMFVGGGELERFALEWGQHCEVVAPGWLRERVIGALEEAVLLYRSSTTESIP